MLSFKTEIGKLEAKNFADNNRKQVEETRSFLSMVEEFQQTA